MGQPDYSKMDHADLLNLRANIPPDDPRQIELAPMEHRAFAREWAKSSPVMASLSLPFAIPAYTAGKSVGLINARTPASMTQMTEGYKGMWEGLSSLFQ
ncbi:hypothetical protein RIVERRIDER_24 [Xanthomonas phage RiverRider]|uniref:Uncharacterized protein n=1 Tax=Xanthomonas phage RiverRider TaxID=2108116 RepID=A0A2P1JUS6_9CAUD|nr:hypothetical protein HWB58_gp24 [Xanthomonas phage RiverRider]AVO23112.1 hypothetical protein RIVERRIDER_24 [Xanthomonas phage RiverRider]